MPEFRLERPATIKPLPVDSQIRKNYEVTSKEVILSSDYRSLRIRSSGQVVKVVPFKKLFEETFRIKSRGGNDTYLFALKVIEESNQAKPSDPITPIVYSPAKGHHYFYIPQDNVGQAEQLLSLHAEEFEPYLPFRISAEDLDKLRAGDLTTRIRLTRRLFWAGARLLSKLAEEDQFLILTKVVHHPRVWEVLKNSTPGTVWEVDGYKYFAAALNSRKFNYHRDNERAKKVRHPYRYLEDGLLREFFINNPPGSDRAQRLLGALPGTHRSLFKLHFLGNRSRLEIADALSLDPEFVYSKYKYSRVILEKMLQRPDSQWVEQGVLAQMRRLRSSKPQLFQTLLGKATSLQKEVINLRYIEGLSLTQIAQRLHRTINAVKSLDHRIRAGLQEPVKPD